MVFFKRLLGPKVMDEVRMEDVFLTGYSSTHFTRHGNKLLATLGTFPRVKFEKKLTVSEQKKEQLLGVKLTPVDWQKTNAYVYARVRGGLDWENHFGIDGNPGNRIQWEWIGFLLRHGMATAEIQDRENDIGADLVITFGEIFTPFDTWLYWARLFNHTEYADKQHGCLLL